MRPDSRNYEEAFKRREVCLYKKPRNAEFFLNSDTNIVSGGSDFLRYF